MESFREGIRLSLVTRALTVFILFTYFYIFLLGVNLYNSDFYWHIANGRYIYENRTLPDNDPFLYTSTTTSTMRKDIILKGYWLAEVVFYIVYKNFEEKGIIFLRSTILLSILLIVYLLIRKKTSSHLMAILFTINLFFILRNYSGERPQLFTFLFFSIILYLLEGYRDSISRRLYLIPFLVMVLSNLHPGYIVCVLLLFLYLSGEAFSFFILRKVDRKNILKDLSLVFLTSILLSGLNPCGYSVYIEIFNIKRYTENIIEFSSPFWLYYINYQNVDLPYVVPLILSSAGIIYYLKKRESRRIIPLVAFILMSLLAIRFVLFFAIYSSVVIGEVIMSLWNRLKLNERLRFFLKQEAYIYALLFILITYNTFNAMLGVARRGLGPETTFHVPLGAGYFLSNIHLNGNIFNEYGFGGYLVWKLYPEKRLFIDGRSLEINVLNEYFSTAFITDKDKSPEDVFRKYGINVVVMPPLSPVGEIFPLVEWLLKSDDWVLIYSDHLSMIFVRDGQENACAIEKYRKEKKEGINTIILQAAGRAMNNTKNPYYLLSLSKAFYMQGRLDDARKAIRIAYERAPENRIVKKWFEWLNESK